MTARKELYDYLLNFFLNNPNCDQSDVAQLAKRAFNASSEEIVKDYIPMKVELSHKDSNTFEAKNKKMERKAFKDKSTFEGF